MLIAGEWVEGDPYMGFIFARMDGLEILWLGCGRFMQCGLYNPIVGLGWSLIGFRWIGKPYLYPLLISGHIKSGMSNHC